MTFVSQGLSLLAIITALSFYAGMVLAAISIAQLLLDIIKPKSGKPKTESITRHSRKKTKTGQTESKSTSQAPQ
ncbi:MAG: hypothetical protein M1387_05615 [Thaumarchaeota archaeon]|nr:hypothetical protein [Nitrososphaerota archaeon]